MAIAFEHVSYSYRAPLKPKRAGKGTRNSVTSGHRGPGSNLDPGYAGPDGSEPSRQPDWGSTADAHWAINDICLTLADGDFLGIAGHTGSGKSTLIQHMNALLHPTLGRVLVDGNDLANKKNATAARSKVGLVFQYPEHQLFAATVYDDVAFGPRNMGLSANETEQRVRTALLQVALDFDLFARKSPFELSGGQQRRVAFAGVLAMQPSVLVLDEPVAGLDPHTRSEFLDLIGQLHQEGLSVVIVSHNMDDLAHFCNRILVLNGGKQFFLGSPEELFTQAETLKSIGLGVPSAQRIADFLKAEGLPLGDELHDLERLASEITALYQARS